MSLAACLVLSRYFPPAIGSFDSKVAQAHGKPTNSCSFDGCPSKKKGGPFLYYFTAHRNRGGHYNLWIRTMYELLGDTFKGCLELANRRADHDPSTCTRSNS